MDRIGKEDPEIGPVTRDDNAGFYCHPTLVLDPEKNIPIGMSSIILWNRRWDKANKYERDYKGQPIEEKESYRWIDSALQTKELLSETSMLTIIGDRESDIFEEIATVPDQRTHLLVRSCWNRNLKDSPMKLFEYLDSLETKIVYELFINGNKKRKSRTAQIALRFGKVKLQKPINRDLKNYPDYVEVWAIQAAELPESVPQGEEPIKWRLLTTHDIKDEQDAIKCIEWYKMRWHIEELFRVLKSKGLQIESSQLETGAALKKLTVIALQVALTTMTLKLSLQKPEDINAEIIFSKDQIIFIQQLINKLEGKTTKQKNPHTKYTLAWAAWAIARLSGWSGYSSQGPPGYITIKTGLDRFNDNYKGYQMAMDLFN